MFTLTVGKNKLGYTLVELMIVVAIIGILAMVSIPLYMSYIQKSRVKTYVYPGLHSIENNMSLYYAIANTLPEPSALPEMMKEADTTYFNVAVIANELKITIDSPPGPQSMLSRMDGMVMYLAPDTEDKRIRTWALRGTLADYLGISTN